MMKYMFVCDSCKTEQEGHAIGTPVQKTGIPDGWISGNAAFNHYKYNDKGQNISTNPNKQKRMDLCPKCADEYFKLVA